MPFDYKKANTRGAPDRARVKADETPFTETYASPGLMNVGDIESTNPAEANRQKTLYMGMNPMAGAGAALLLWTFFSARDQYVLPLVGGATTAYFLKDTRVGKDLLYAGVGAAGMRLANQGQDMRYLGAAGGVALSELW